VPFREKILHSLSNKNKEMPPAGPYAKDRQSAHLKWAAKYNHAGDMHKAAAHFGRAMHYGMIGDQEASTSEPAKRQRTVARRS